MDIHEPQFTRSEVVSVTGVDIEALKSWLKNGFIAVAPHQQGGSGKRRLFSVMDMIKIAVVSELTLLRVPSSTANEIIASEKFEEWVELSRTTSEDKEAKYYFAAMYWDGDKVVVQYFCNANQWDFFSFGKDNVETSPKVVTIIRLLDIVLKVIYGADDLLREEKPALSKEEEVIASMRKHLKDAGDA